LVINTITAINPTSPSTFHATRVILLTERSHFTCHAARFTVTLIPFLLFFFTIHHLLSFQIPIPDQQLELISPPSQVWLPSLPQLSQFTEQQHQCSFQPQHSRLREVKL
jgi:hypothetical protein